ncbi:hypothetical protein KAT80_03910 [Candidatus Pacearchaeota archaeon]|nr:hypothetical protein [Candidatus Pacearchaeota archaeon]
MLNEYQTSAILIGAIIGAVFGSTTSIILSKVSEKFLIKKYNEIKKKEGNFWATLFYIFSLVFSSIVICGLVMIVLFLLIIAFLIAE